MKNITIFAGMDGIGSGKSGFPLTRDIPLGEELVRYGTTLVCVPRPKGLWPPCNACKGCFFRRRSAYGGVIMTCNDIRCSSFDRMDGKNVWFVEKRNLIDGKDVE